MEVGVSGGVDGAGCGKASGGVGLVVADRAPTRPGRSSNVMISIPLGLGTVFNASSITWRRVLPFTTTLEGSSMSFRLTNLRNNIGDIAADRCMWLSTFITVYISSGNSS